MSLRLRIDCYAARINAPRRIKEAKAFGRDREALILEQTLERDLVQIIDQHVLDQHVRRRGRGMLGSLRWKTPQPSPSPRTY